MAPSKTYVSIYLHCVLQHPRQSLAVSEAISETPLFKSFLKLDTNYLYFEPSLSVFHEGMMEVLISFKDCTLAFPNLVPDPFFHSFTRYVIIFKKPHLTGMLWFILLRPLINRKLEEKDCGEGPSLEIIFEDDVHMKEIQEKIIVNFTIVTIQYVPTYMAKFGLVIIYCHINSPWFT